MKKSFRLTRSTDFKRVRRFGESYAHPLVVLYTTASGKPQSRIGVSAGRWVGGAVDRNRAKRLLREAVRNLYSQILPGNDLLLIARAPLAGANLSETQSALLAILQRAKLISNL
ncbi:MAG: ribonuclease P protein component [Chloroflexota bacterium]